MTDREDTIQVLYGSAASWAAKDLVLLKGEHGFEWDTGRFKIGDEVSRFSELDYYIPEMQIKSLIEAAIADLPVNTGGGISSAVFNAHVNNPMPHPDYDDGSSFVLLYENAKV